MLPHELQLERNPVPFYIENQGVYLWAFERGRDNPRVLGRVNDEAAPWQAEAEQLAGFLLEVCFFETLIGAPFGASASWLSPAEVDRILQNWRPLPYGAWHWPAYPTRFYTRGGACAVVMPNGEGLTFCCGAQAQEELSFMLPYVSPDWEVCTFGPPRQG
ncbi:MAG: hypothetical protein M3R24_37945 [Chloroflexota bacterium]|nr:hypothetical protein [Chloroflexota bacterium]